MSKNVKMTRSDLNDKMWLNVTEAAIYLQVSRQTIYNLIERGILPFYEVRGIRGKRIKKEDLESLFQKSGPTSEQPGN